MKKVLHILTLGLFLTICSYGPSARIDSLRLDNFIKDAMKLAKANIQTDNFFKQYETEPDDSSYVVTVNLTIGHLFSNKQSHLLIRRQVPWCEYLDLYLITGNDLKSVIFREQGEMTYINDTIRDVNGDDFNDFLVKWYPSSGCCRRDVYNVYLNQADKGTFTSDYQFINPTFSPNEKTIRGVEYGHPDEVDFYKYKWTGLTGLNHESLTASILLC